MQQQNEQLTQALSQASEEMKTKKYEIDSRERMKALERETQAAIKLSELQSREAITLLTQPTAELDMRPRHKLEGAEVPPQQTEQDFNEQQMPDQQMVPDQQQPLMEGQ